ncbi:TIGR03619 family F420-dependent LLM class oxidoreductase, partial [Gammaproteobacteria bacterium]|nr:TIGR03619 family F420-dependent LLM class oxidoreductase [Gammaproteobacteria bacterium]
FDSVSVTDHVVMGKNLHKYPFGKFPLPSEAPWYEPLSVLTMIASHTTKIKLATAILIAPLRNPALLAKTAASLDAISKGRLELGVGLGWQKEEFDTAGVNFEDRAEIFWETLDICKLLWQDSPTSFKGKHFHFDDIWCHPKPVQGQDLPLLFGLKMTHDNAQRIAKVGHGWIPIKTSRDFISQGRDILAEAFVKEGRQDQPRIRGQLPTCVDDNGIPNIDLTLNQLEKSMAAGLDEVEVFPINFIQASDDIYRILKLISEVKKS